MTFITAPAPKEGRMSVVLHGIAAVLSAFAYRLWRAQEVSRRRRLLNQMPDYLLKDIGVSRSEIDYVAAALVDGRQDPTRRPRGRAQ
jgi:uncharacterized protein YjiS (DUF1127 family)